MRHRLIRRPSLALAALVVAAVGSACSSGGGAISQADSSASRAAALATRPSAPADTQRVVLAVKGMYCASCEQTVATMLRRTAGVVRADVSVERGEATVSYDSTRTSAAQLVQVVQALGYDAAVKRT